MKNNPKTKRKIAGFLVALFSLLSFSIGGVNGASSVTSKVTNVGTASISIEVKSAVDGKAYVEYGYSKSKYDQKSPISPLVKGKSTNFEVSGLTPAKKVYLRVRYAIGSKNTFSALAQMSATTLKGGDEYVFAVQADPHMDDNSSAEVFNSTLGQIVKANPGSIS